MPLVVGESTKRDGAAFPGNGLPPLRGRALVVVVAVFVIAIVLVAGSFVLLRRADVLSEGVGATACALLFAACLLAVVLAFVRWHDLRRGEATRVLLREIESAFEAAPAGFALVDDAGTIRRANAGFCTLLGRNAGALAGTGLGDLLLPPVAGIPSAFDDVVRSGAGHGAFDLTLAGDRSESVYVTCHARATLRGSESEPLWLIGFEDVTAHRRALASLAERTDTLNALLAASRDGMVLVGPDRRILYTNRSFTELISIDGESLAGVTTEALLERIAERSGEALDSFRRLLGAEDDDLRGSLLPFRTNLRNPTPRTLLLSAVPVHGHDGRWLGRLAMARDVTQEENARRAKDVFLGNVSHELRTPLTSIAGFVELLGAGQIGPVTEEQREMLGIVAENVSRLTALVGDLLSVGEFEEDRPVFSSVDLGALLRSIVDLERANAVSKGLELRIEIEGDVVVEGDAKRLHQLFANLVSNALKYTRVGHVRVFARPLGDAVVRVDVTDTGIGIEAKDRARIFERFVRIESAETRGVRGTGLGLSIAKLVTDQHNGRIEIESAPGKGSEFRVLLPRTRGSRIPAPTELIAPTRRERPLVLVIDDDLMAQRIITAALRPCSIDVVGAEDGQSGIQAALHYRPDVLIVDVELPDINGYEVTARLQRDHGLSNVPVLVISGREPPAALEPLGVAAYLQKPVRSEILRAEVLRWIGRDTLTRE